MSRQVARGSALVVAMTLLLLGSVMTLAALQVGVFEQRTTGNDARARIVAEVAEAGITQGAEYLRLQPGLLAPGGQWRPCAELADSTQFPCGAIADATRRDRMFFWANATGGVDRNNDGRIDVLDARMLPLADALPASARIDAVGAYERVSLGVGVVLCRLAVGDAIRCTTDDIGQGDRSAFHLVSLASLPDEGARTTVSQAFAQARSFTANLHQPTVVASGHVDLTGALHVVANPNAGGGDGVPVSVWTRGDVDKPAPVGTCQLGEFLRQGALHARVEDEVVICEACRCTDEALSRDRSGDLHPEGIDILDVDGGDGANGRGLNADVRPSEFPCDLFAQVFGVAARVDGDGDGFCESRVPPVAFVSPVAMTSVPLDADEAFLYRHASSIVPRDATAQSLMRFDQPLPVEYPGAALSGILWCQRDCDIAPGAQLGTPSKPVLLVVDGSMRIAGRVFGMVVLRDPRTDALDPSTGGTARLRMEGGASVHGSVVVQGAVERASGASAIVFNAQVLANFAHTIPLVHGSLPGAWTDRWSY